MRRLAAVLLEAGKVCAIASSRTVIPLRGERSRVALETHVPGTPLRPLFLGQTLTAATRLYAPQLPGVAARCVAPPAVPMAVLLIEAPSAVGAASPRARLSPPRRSARGALLLLDPRSERRFAELPQLPELDRGQSSLPSPLPHGVRADPEQSRGSIRIEERVVGRLLPRG